MILSQPAYSYRLDARVPEFSDRHPVTVMDARCSLCAKGARWIAHHDHREEFRIIPLQSDLGRALMSHYGIDPQDPSSWLLLEDGRAFSSLDAVIRVGGRLGGIWKLLGLLNLIPRFLQDKAYRLVARNRFKWFGTADLCSMPDQAVQKRLIS